MINNTISWIYYPSVYFFFFLLNQISFISSSSSSYVNKILLFSNNKISRKAFMEWNGKAHPRKWHEITNDESSFQLRYGEISFQGIEWIAFHSVEMDNLLLSNRSRGQIVHRKTRWTLRNKRKNKICPIVCSIANPFSLFFLFVREFTKSYFRFDMIVHLTGEKFSLLDN